MNRRSTFFIKYIFFTLLLAAFRTPMLNGSPFVYVMVDSNLLNIYDAANNTLIYSLSIPNASVPVFNDASIAISPDGKTAYFCSSNAGVNTLQRVETATRYILSPIDLSTFAPEQIAITPNGKFAYVTSSSGILVVDLTSNMVVGPVNLGTLSQPGAIHITPDGLTAYVIDTSDTTKIYSIDLSTNIAQLAIEVPGAIFENTTISPDSAYLYASDGAGGQILQYNISGSQRNTPQLTGTITYSYLSPFTPLGMAITPNGKTLYVANSSPKALGAIDISDPLTPIPSPSYLDLSSIGGTWAPLLMAITPDSNALYLTLPVNTNKLIAINITTPLAPTLTTTFSTGSTFANALAITPILPPSSASGCKTKNVFLLQTDYINKITWTAPSTALSPAPTSYNIFRDAGLTELAGTVPASGALQFYDHDRNPKTLYTYYVTSAISGGSQSAPATVTVTNPC